MGRSRGLLIASEVDCRTAAELLEAGQYERVAELIREAAARGQTSDPTTIPVLDAAQRISLACRQCRAEAEWHTQACAKLREREHQLEQELDNILKLINSRGLAEIPEGKQLRESTAEKSEPDRRASKRARSFDLWKNLWKPIRTLLQFKPKQDRHPPDVELPVASAKKPVPPFTEEAELSAAECRTVLASGAAPHSLMVRCLGAFQVHQDDHPIGDWPSTKGKSVFKYLITHRHRPVAKEVLMELFWPDANPRCARNSLNVAIYRMRQALSTRSALSYVLFQNDCYFLNPDLNVWVDFESFEEHIANARALERRGDKLSAIRQYRAAEALYAGELLEEDRYESWVIPQRQSLQEDYLRALDQLSRYYFEQEDYDACVTACNKILAVDACEEEAHRRIMRCYSRLKRSSLAMRQYHDCVKALKRELGLVPSSPTIELYGRIQNRQPV